MTPQAAEKLKSAEARYEDLTRLVAIRPCRRIRATYRTHSKALAELQPLVERYREYKQRRATS